MNNALLLLTLLLVPPLVGCDRDGAEDPEAPSGANAETAEQAEEVSCTFSVATRSLVTLNLESEDGTCVINLPSDLSGPAELTVRASIVGHDNAASVRIPADQNAYYYATGGSVVVEAFGGDRVRGYFVVTDDEQPQVGGPFRGEFDLALE